MVAAGLNTVTHSASYPLGQSALPNSFLLIRRSVTTHPSTSLQNRGTESLVDPAQQDSADIHSTLQNSGQITSGNRYVVCELLAGRGISSVIWFEDLLALHGSDTQVWDLNLLVRDPPEAASALRDFGALPIYNNFLHPLSMFLDSLIELWLNISSRDYVDRLQFALYIGCLIHYCYYLKDANGESVRDPAFANHLKLEHREVHYDIVDSDPQKENVSTTNRHQHHARKSRKIREGLFIPKPHQKGVFQPPLTTLLEQ